MTQPTPESRVLLEKQVGYSWGLTLEQRLQPANTKGRYDYTSWKGRLSGNTDTLTDAINQIKTAAKELTQLKETQQQS